MKHCGNMQLFYLSFYSKWQLHTYTLNDRQLNKLNIHLKFSYISPRMNLQFSRILLQLLYFMSDIREVDKWVQILPVDAVTLADLSLKIKVMPFTGLSTSESLWNLVIGYIFLRLKSFRPASFESLNFISLRRFIANSTFPIFFEFPIRDL